MKLSTNSEKQKIAIQMANHFEKTFTNEDLILWHIRANRLLFEHYDGITIEMEASIFLAEFEWYLTSELLNAKSDNRSSIIEKGLPELLGSINLDKLKIALSQIGKAFLESYTKLVHDPCSLTKFMGQLSCFMGLAEMYSDYKYYSK